MNQFCRFLIVSAAVMAVASAAAEEAPSQYAGQQTREIKALSEQEVSGYLEGNGMGYAKAAELNHYPGPRHALDLAEELELSTDQVKQVQAIFEDMLARAVALGEKIVKREAELDHRFASGSIESQSLDALVSKIAELNGQLRYVHLAAHLQTRAVLTQRQVQHYDALRGYSASHGKEHQHDH